MDQEPPGPTITSRNHAVVSNAVSVTLMPDNIKNEAPETPEQRRLTSSKFRAVEESAVARAKRLRELQDDSDDDVLAQVWTESLETDTEDQPLPPLLSRMIPDATHINRPTLSERRGRGRPRKHPVVIRSEPPKKRGRPRKLVDPSIASTPAPEEKLTKKSDDQLVNPSSSNVSSPNSGVKTGRARGRPRKIPRTAE